MENPKARILLLFLCMLLGLAFFFMARHERAKVEMSEEMKTGVKVFTDPESLIKEYPGVPLRELHWKPELHKPGMTKSEWRMTNQ